METPQISIWRNPRFFYYALGLIINCLGSAVYMTILPLMVYHITGSAVSMTIMAVCETLPRALLGFFVIGSLVDRVSRRVVFLGALAMQAVCSLLIAVFEAGGSLEIWMLYLLGALIAIFHECTRTAEFAIVPAMFKERLREAKAVLNGAFTMTLILGPVLAGLLLSVVQYDTLLWVNAVTYFAPVILCIWTRIPHEKNLGGIHSPKQIWLDLRESVSYIISQKTMLGVMSVVAIGNLATAGIMTAVLFYLKHDFALDDHTISSILAINGLGPFLSSFVVTKFKHVPNGKMMFWGLAITSFSFLILLVPNYWLVAAAMLVWGLGRRTFLMAYEILIQDLSPNDLIGRVGSTLRMVSFLTTSLSTSLLGVLVAAIGSQWTFVVAVVLSLSPLVVIVNMSIHRDRPVSSKMAS